MRLRPRRRGSLPLELTPVHRWCVTWRQLPGALDVLRAEWMPSVISYLDVADEVTIAINVSATTAFRAEQYVRRQLRREGIEPLSIEAKRA